MLQQPAENAGSSSGLMRVHQGRTPREEQARIVGRMVEQGVEKVNDLRIVLRHGIAQGENLADESVLGMRLELALQGRNSFRVELGSEAG